MRLLRARAASLGKAGVGIPGLPLMPWVLSKSGGFTLQEGWLHFFGWVNSPFRLCQFKIQAW